jgi:hypothetical protein
VPAGDLHLAAYSLNSLGSWSEAATETVHVDDAPLIVPASGEMGGTVVLSFADWWQDGSVTATRAPLPAPAPDGLFLVGDDCLDIETSVGFSGSAEISLRYDAGERTPEQEQALRLYHYEGGEWIDITSAIDTETNTISGTSDSFSPFAVFTPQAEPAGGEEEAEIVSVPASSPWSLMLLALIGPALLTVASRKRASC